MAEETGSLKREVAFLGIEGMAIRRDWLDDPNSLADREREIRALLSELDSSERTLTPVQRHTPSDGYAQWSASYDGDNALIAGEEPIIRRILEELPRGDALDAACGTGRYTAVLASAGHRVIAADVSEEMLRIARRKVPVADVRVGPLTALPVADASVDLVVCTLALTHLEHLDRAIAEFARVSRPGGVCVISDIHPVMASFGGGAVFQVAGEREQAVHYIPNYAHQVSAYLAAFRRYGLEVANCLEPLIDEQALGLFPHLNRWPDALRRAFAGLPYLLVWQLQVEG